MNTLNLLALLTFSAGSLLAESFDSQPINALITKSENSSDRQQRPDGQICAHPRGSLPCRQLHDFLKESGAWLRPDHKKK